MTSDRTLAPSRAPDASWDVTPHSPSFPRHYTTYDVTRLLGIAAAQVRGLTRAGVLTPARGRRGEYRFTFRDLVLLRTAKALEAERIPAYRVRRAFARLKEQLPPDRSLTEVRLAADGDRIVASDGGVAWNPESGQFQLDFTGSAAATAEWAEPEFALPSQTALSAQEWFEFGSDLEGTAPEEARDAYSRALDLEPDHAHALVNLGRLLHQEGRVADAEDCYRRALAASPRHATAAFNLGIVLEDLGRPAEAIRAYEGAIGSDPELADAYFNLSRLCERAGKRAAALQYLSRYKRLTE